MKKFDFSIPEIFIKQKKRDRRLTMSASIFAQLPNHLIMRIVKEATFAEDAAKDYWEDLRLRPFRRKQSSITRNAAIQKHKLLKYIEPRGIWIEMYGVSCIGYHGYINGHHKTNDEKRGGRALLLKNRNR